ncbi:DUF2238 domain-containing protein [Candidatus Saccharibacteria bacterium]|nr:DUF2238 domain-containing protein [Candidatus Saccharibacteria bacterium]MBQ9016713.1 DUF2238 domain-containing protein [Candidatus Saccharibacteria bacterium]
MKQYLKQINLCIKVIIITVGVLLSILYLVPGTQFYKIWSYLATIALAFAPEIWRHVFHLKASDEVELAYYIFLIPAMVLGIDLDIYKIWTPLDKIAHLSSGVLTAVVAWEVAGQAYAKKPGAKWFKYLFMICFVAMTAAVWECFEYGSDRLFGTHMQELISVGLDDTMQDILFAIGGGILTTGLVGILEHSPNTKKKKKKS